MRTTTTLRLIHAAAAFTLIACAAPANQPLDGPDTGRGREPAYVRSIYGPTWTLVAMSGAAAPTGSGARPATMLLYSGSDKRATGFAGCNGWSSTYTLAGRDSIQFTAPVSTRMACADGMELESRFLRIIEQTRRGAQRDSTLTFFTLTGDSAKFVAR